MGLTDREVEFIDFFSDDFDYVFRAIHYAHKNKKPLSKTFKKFYFILCLITLNCILFFINFTPETNFELFMGILEEIIIIELIGIPLLAIIVSQFFYRERGLQFALGRYIWIQCLFLISHILVYYDYHSYFLISRMMG